MIKLRVDVIEELLLLRFKDGLNVLLVWQAVPKIEAKLHGYGCLQQNGYHQLNALST
jgi:hypothetical protein